MKSTSTLSAPARIVKTARHEYTLMDADGKALRCVHGRNACHALRQEFPALPFFWHTKPDAK